MKKFFISLFILFCISLSANSQEFYYILKIVGKLTVDGTQLKAKDKVFDTTKIIFSSINDYAFIVHFKKGTLLLRPTKNTQTKSEIFAYLKDNLLPIRKPSSTRDPLLFDTPDDFKEYFKPSPFLMLPTNEFMANANNFPMDTSSFFFIRYTYRFETINKRLNFKGNKVIIDRNDLFLIDNKGINPTEAKSFKLFYFEKVKLNSKFLTDIDFSIPDLTQVLDEINMLKVWLKDSDQSLIDSEISKYINTQYGNFDEKAFLQFIH